MRDTEPERGVTHGQAPRPYEVQNISLVVAGTGFQVREFTVAAGRKCRGTTTPR